LSSSSSIVRCVHEALAQVELGSAEAGDLPDPQAGEAGEHAGGVDLQASRAHDDAGDLLHRPDRAHFGPEGRRVLDPLGGLLLADAQAWASGAFLWSLLAITVGFAILVDAGLRRGGCHDGNGPASAGKCVS
jgi:hypothetical protein